MSGGAVFIFSSSQVFNPKQNHDAMQLIPEEWNVVIIGRWNRAILTPRGIAKRLFKLAEGTNVEVSIALDEVGRYQVKYAGCGVDVTRDVLLIQPQQNTAADLSKAMEIGVNALESLPETPVSAVGVNFKYVFSENSDRMDQLLSISTDQWLSDSSYVIEGKSVRRVLKFDGGVLNLDILHANNAPPSVRFNFEKTSESVSVLKSWLTIPTSRFEECANQILSHLSEMGEVTNAD